MIEDGRAFGNTIALKHILALLERKSLIQHAEITKALDAALEEVQNSKADLTPDARGAAGRAVGYLFVR
jgi:hypothetical protein